MTEFSRLPNSGMAALSISTHPAGAFKCPQPPSVDVYEREIATAPDIYPKTSTFDLARFIRETAPDPEPPAPSPSRTSSLKNSSLNFLRQHRLAPSRPAEPTVPPLLKLPENVVSKTAINGQKYLQIVVPGSVDDKPRSQPLLRSNSNPLDQIANRSKDDIDEEHIRRLQRDLGHTSQGEHVRRPAKLRKSNPQLNQMVHQPDDGTAVEQEGLSISRPSSRVQQVFRSRKRQSRNSLSSSASLGQLKDIANNLQVQSNISNGQYRYDAGQPRAHQRGSMSISAPIQHTRPQTSTITIRRSTNQLNDRQNRYIPIVTPGYDKEPGPQYERRDPMIHVPQRMASLRTPQPRQFVFQDGYQGPLSSHPLQPGPAPSKALPSLPRGSLDSSRIRAIAEQQRRSLPSNLERQAISSTPKRNSDPAWHPLPSTMNDSRAFKKPHHTLDDLARNAVKSRSSSAARREREEIVRARKLRDVQSLRSLRSQAEEDASQQRHTEKENEELSQLSQNPLGTTLRALKEPSDKTPQELPAETRQETTRSASPTNTISDIMNSVDDDRIGFPSEVAGPLLDKCIPGEVYDIKRVSTASSPASPVLPSSDDEYGRTVPCRKSNGTSYSSTGPGPGTVTASIAAGGVSRGSARSSRTITSRQEIESRLSALERRNELLEATLVALLRSSSAETVSEAFRGPLADLQTSASELEAQTPTNAKTPSQPVSKRLSSLQTLIDRLATEAGKSSARAERKE